MVQRRLTFGVEFEFKLATLAEDVKDPEPEDLRPVRGLMEPYQRDEIGQTRENEYFDMKLKKKVAKVLDGVGLPTMVSLDPEDRDDSLVMYPWLRGKWVVKSDSSVFGIESAYGWWSLRINTPALILCPEALRAVDLACKLLTSNFRCYINESCGLHIHFGNGTDNFNAKTMQKLMAFLWCFEPVIDQVHPRHRHNANYYRSIRQSSVYGDMLQESGATVTSVLRKILMHTNTRTLLRQMADSYSAMYKEACYTGHLRPGSWSGMMHDKKITIEFRGHAGTLDGQRAVYWIQLVVGLIEFGEDCDLFTLAGFLLQHAELVDGGGKVYEIHQLLRDIGLEEVSQFYEFDLMTWSS